jgi:hypothetical protein
VNPQLETEMDRLGCQMTHPKLMHLRRRGSIKEKKKMQSNSCSKVSKKSINIWSVSLFTKLFQRENILPLFFHGEVKKERPVMTSPHISQKAASQLFNDDVSTTYYS